VTDTDLSCKTRQFLIKTIQFQAAVRFKLKNYFDVTYNSLYFENTMAIQQIHGRWGEDQAVAFLLQEGLDVLERNWRYKRAEVDVIGKDNGVLVFVEVKTRAYLSFGRPEEMVDKRKKRFLIDAAMAYMRSVGYEWEIRFDIVAVTGQPGDMAQIVHFRDAFFPGLDF
jgi:putative endonuclease